MKCKGGWQSSRVKVVFSTALAVSTWQRASQEAQEIWIARSNWLPEDVVQIDPVSMSREG